jgi:hypothetical protein
LLLIARHSSKKRGAFYSAAALIEIIFPTQLLAETLGFYHTHPEAKALEESKSSCKKLAMDSEHLLNSEVAFSTKIRGFEALLHSQFPSLYIIYKLGHIFDISVRIHAFL